MRSPQRVLGIPIMIEGDLSPSRGYMAGITLVAEMIFVFVILKMAGDAGRLQLVGEWIIAVAIAAGQLGVPSVERESSVALMIEARILPVPWIVAISAIRATASFVSIVLLVAAKARGRSRLECRVNMTVPALHVRVLSEQRVAGRIVVELNILPACGRVAVCAGITEIPGMNVVLSVTTDAVRWRVAMFVLRCVAVGAFDFGMLARKMEVSQLVIESLFVEIYNVGIAAGVIRMAAAALAIRYVR